MILLWYQILTFRCLFFARKQLKRIEHYKTIWYITNNLNNTCKINEAPFSSYLFDNMLAGSRGVAPSSTKVLFGGYAKGYVAKS